MVVANGLKFGRQVCIIKVNLFAKFFEFGKSFLFLSILILFKIKLFIPSHRYIIHFSCISHKIKLAADINPYSLGNNLFNIVLNRLQRGRKKRLYR